MAKKRRRAERNKRASMLYLHDEMWDYLRKGRSGVTESEVRALVEQAVAKYGKK